MSWEADAHAACRAAGLRRGAARSAVIGALGRAGGGLTAVEIAERARTDRGPVSIASAYRILGDLVDLLLVHPVELGTGQTHYELVRADGHHEHHLVCEGCGRTDRFADADLERAVHAAEHRLGFRSRAHDIVLHGRCQECDAPS